MKPEADYLFEASWEVCNKVGGIYTVVKSKAYAMKEIYKNYFLIGPYFEDKAVVELSEKKPPAELKKIFTQNSARQSFFSITKQTWYKPLAAY